MVRSHSERAAINTPVQGSAADIATAAMLCIHNNKELKKMGWKLLLQVCCLTTLSSVNYASGNGDQLYPNQCTKAIIRVVHEGTFLNMNFHPFDFQQIKCIMHLQVHDEVILEGPEDSAEIAKRIVINCLEKPFPAPGGIYHNPLLVDLAVDCNIAHTWYEAK